MHSNGLSLEAAPPDRMKSTELEAAEALAVLAQSSEKAAEAKATAAWGNKGKRASKKRVKCESNSVHNMDLVTQEDGAQKELLKDRDVNGDAATNQVGGEENDEQLQDLPKVGNNNPASGIARSRNTLTEAEKEAKRIRRILANRESARQTIRRRQALYDELNKKATDLSSENDKLKREKELALKEYQSLETTNKHLKERISNAIKAKVEASRAGHNSVNVNTSPSANCRLLLYNRYPLMPVCWSPIIQTSEASQLSNQPQNPFFIPSSIPLPVSGIVSVSQEQENSVNFNVPRTTCYMVPYPCFFPLPDNGNGLYQQPPIHSQNAQDETSVHNHQSTSSSSKNLGHAENHNSCFPTNEKTEASCFAVSYEKPDLNELPMDGIDQYAVLDSKEANHSTLPENAVGTTYTGKFVTGSQTSDVAANECDLIENSLGVKVALKKNDEATSNSSKKLMEAFAAAEARKRRKELTKLKNIHGRQCKMQI